MFTERWAVPFLWVGKMLECSETKVASRRGTRRERHLSETEYKRFSVAIKSGMKAERKRQRTFRRNTALATERGEKGAPLLTGRECLDLRKENFLKPFIYPCEHFFLSCVRSCRIPLYLRGVWVGVSWKYMI